MKVQFKFIILLLWTSIVYVINKIGFFKVDLDTFIKLIYGLEDFKVPIFIILSTFRVITFIPATIFMIIGGLIFNPFLALLLSLLCITLSESIVYFVSKSLIGINLEKYLSKKYPNIRDILIKNKSSILFLGVLCPLTPTDAICSLASSTGISYLKFIIIVATGNIPMISLYSFLGDSLFSSSFNIVFMIITITIITLYTFYLWKNAQYKHKTIKQ